MSAVSTSLPGFESLLESAKLRLLRMHHETHLGHLGGNLSCLDALMALWHLVKKSDDRFILSKGHAAGALYVTLWSIGKLTDEDLATFCGEDTLVAGHPSGKGIPETLFSTGSLGHGPSLAAGLALAAKYQDSGRHIYCLCSDGEWQEGSCWEALTFAIHHKLNNLTLLIDQNGLQGFGRTEDIISCSDLTSRIAAFNAQVQRINGHNWWEIKAALQVKSPEKPSVLIMDTIKGRGLHFEGKMESHYLPLSDEQYQAACLRIRGLGES